MATPLRLPDARAVGDYRLRSGHKIRLRPNVSTGGWLVDLWSQGGELILAGEPLVITDDLWAQYRARGGFPAAPLRVEGPEDPSSGLPLSAQDLVLCE